VEKTSESPSRFEMQSQPGPPLKKFCSRTLALFHARLAPLGIVASFIGVAVFLNACSSLKNTAMVPLEIPGAHYVGNKVCSDCHADIVRKFPASPHARFHFRDTGETSVSSARLDENQNSLSSETHEQNVHALNIGCESCHGPGSRHVETGNAKFIINPGKNPATCFQCHVQIHADFTLPQHHPVIEGTMNCIQCHDPHGGDIFKHAGGLAMARLNESCAQCHQDQTRPFVFEHEAMREGCTVCHNPHGSINRKMLVQNDPNLCLRCHAQTRGTSGEIFIGSVSHTAFLRIGTCWTSGCHSAIHGSNVDPRFRF
jgi:predicted CXXCH cytochrome family protein